ncbi:MAG: T9SS type A sorting domain-containing protein [Saprospiraceae bacterium]
MRKIYSSAFLLLFGMLSTTILTAQNYQRPKIKNELLTPETASQYDAIHQEEHYTQPKSTSPKTLRSRALGEIILGTTQYDLQTNSSVQNRLNNLGNGKFDAAWTYSSQGATGTPDRGTGFVSNNGSGWDPSPNARLEASVRTGWPSLTKTADGTEVVICHNNTASYRLHVLRRPAGSSWTEFDIDTDLPLGSLWPKSAVGGPDGNSVHAIAMATPTGTTTNGSVYEGVDGHLLYYRSLDAGATWDKIDVIIPGIDSTEYTFMSADDYSIDVKGNTVAVLVMNPWGDIKVAKSTDNGGTWNILTVYDFPIGPGFMVDDPYDIDTLPPDTFTMAGNAIRSNDGAGYILIDDSGNVHVFYSEIWVGDNNAVDDSYTIYIGLNSIRYWNETMDDTGGVEIAGYLDEDGNGTFDVEVDAYGSYGVGFSSYPTAGLDAQGNIYLAYSAISELYKNENANPGEQHYRHIYLTRSTDGGVTWSDPYDIINPVYSDPDFYGFTEGVFPSMAKVVDDYVHIIYQQDFEPGHSVSGDEDDIADNFMIYTAIPVYELTSTKNVVNPSDIGFRAFPNPANESVTFQIGTEIEGDVRLSLYNNLGQIVQSEFNQGFVSGAKEWNVQIGHLPKGLYIARVSIGSTYSSLKFIKE